MTPSLLQRIELLTLNRLELSELLQQELTENPALEDSTETPPAEAETAGESESGEPDAYEDFDYEYFFGEYLAPGQQRTEYEKRDDRPSFDTFLSTPLSLSDYLNRQLNLLEIPPIFTMSLTSSPAISTVTDIWPSSCTKWLSNSKLQPLWPNRPWRRSKPSIHREWVAATCRSVC